MAMAGESLFKMSNDALRSGDGSFIAVQTSKGCYSAGERIDGFVVLQNNSPRQVDKVLVRITCKERTYWDEEIARHHSEGEGEHRRTWTTYEHHEHRGKVRVSWAAAAYHRLAPLPPPTHAPMSHLKHTHFLPHRSRTRRFS